MTLKIFLEVVELRTKVASVFPFAIGVLFSIAFFHEIHWLNTGLFFIGMLVFDLATTAINNYMDYQKAHSKTYKYQENVIDKSCTELYNLYNGSFVGKKQFYKK